MTKPVLTLVPPLTPSTDSVLKASSAVQQLLETKPIGTTFSDQVHFDRTRALDPAVVAAAVLAGIATGIAVGYALGERAGRAEGFGDGYRTNTLDHLVHRRK